MGKRAKEERGRYTAKRKVDAVMRLLKGDDLDTVSRDLGVTAATLSSWRGLGYPQLAFEILRRYATDIDETRLRAIIDGRTTAPTEEETVALFASGGQWMVTWDDGTLGKITTVPYWHHMAPKVQRWIPVLDGRPTTWPVVTP